MKHNSSIAVIGLGNILLRDEGVGVRVIQKLQQHYTFSPPVKMIDGGTLGFALVNELEGCNTVIVVDAVKAGNEPGTIYRFLRDNIAFTTPLSLSVHDIGFMEALDQWKMIGINPEIIFFGIEPEDMSSWGMELSACITAKVPRLIELIIDELKKYKINVKEK